MAVLRIVDASCDSEGKHDAVPNAAARQASAKAAKTAASSHSSNRTREKSSVAILAESSAAFAAWFKEDERRHFRLVARACTALRAALNPRWSRRAEVSNCSGFAMCMGCLRKSRETKSREERRRAARQKRDKEKRQSKEGEREGEQARGERGGGTKDICICLDDLCNGCLLQPQIRHEAKEIIRNGGFVGSGIQSSQMIISESLQLRGGVCSHSGEGRVVC